MMVLALGCRVTPRPTVTPEQLDGVYKLDRSGQSAGGWHVTSTLTLTAPDHYELETVVRARGEEQEELENGRYRIRGSTLFLASDKRETTELLIRGDSLVGKIGFPGALFAGLVGGPPVYLRQRSP